MFTLYKFGKDQFDFYILNEEAYLELVGNPSPFAVQVINFKYGLQILFCNKPIYRALQKERIQVGKYAVIK